MNVILKIDMDCNVLCFTYISEVTTAIIKKTGTVKPGLMRELRSRKVKP